MHDSYMSEALKHFDFSIKYIIAALHVYDLIEEQPGDNSRTRDVV